METHLTESLRNTPVGQEAEAILRRCVHCGFCLATCPTYQLLGDELDGPRGRIYLIKHVLEGGTPGSHTREHLDRCLSCRSCETTCPSGVEYHRLLDIGRAEVEKRVARSPLDALQRQLLRLVLGRRVLFQPLLRLGQALRPLLPSPIRRQVPATPPAGNWPPTRHPRRMLVLEGCVQPAIAPRINAAAARVLDRAGISLTRAREEGCCGALDYHLDAQRAGLQCARRNIDAWWPHVQAGVEAIVITASGCGAFVKDYGRLLANDPDYAQKAARVDELTRDLSEVVADAAVQTTAATVNTRIAFHSPCTLQHGQGLSGRVEQLLTQAGFELTMVPDAHLCCGSAGTYSILQPRISSQLRDNKTAALLSGRPEVIVTANIGCLTHLQSGTDIRVSHWIELLDEAMM